MATKEIGHNYPTGRHYDEPADWISYVQGLGSLSADEVGNCHFDDTTAFAKITFSGITFNGHTVTLTVESGDAWCDGSGVGDYDATAGCAIDTGSGSAAITIASGQNGVVVDRLQVRNDDTGTYTRQAVRDQGSGNKHTNCLMDCNTANSWVVLAENAEISDSLIICRSGGGGVWADTFVNDTVVQLNSGGLSLAGILIHGYGANKEVYNCLVTDFDTDYSGSASGADYNGSSDTSAPGTTTTHNMTASGTFVNTSTDFRLKSGSEAIGNGQVRSGYETDPFGTSRGTAGGSCDLGFFEFTSASADHELTANDLTAGTPALDTPTIAQVHALTGSDLVGGTPALDTPVLSESHALTANDLTGGTPVLDTPTLAQVNFALIATDLLVSAPVLDTPTLAQVHALTADDLTGAAPVLDTPTLNPPDVVRQIGGNETTRSWLEMVTKADGPDYHRDSLYPDAYEFSTGRKFKGSGPSGGFYE